MATLAGSVVEASEGGQPLIFFVNLDRIVAQDVTVSFQLGGTASSSDYQVKSGSQIISSSVLVPAGSSFASISIYPQADGLTEGDETVTVQLISASGGVQLGSVGVVTGTIHDAASQADAVPGDISSTISLATGQWLPGKIDATGLDASTGDKDYYRISLAAGHLYKFEGDTGLSGLDTLDSIFIRLRDGHGNILPVDKAAGGADPSFTYSPAADGHVFSGR